MLADRCLMRVCMCCWSSLSLSRGRTGGWRGAQPGPEAGAGWRESRSSSPAARVGEERHPPRARGAVTAARCRVTSSPRTSGLHKGPGACVCTLARVSRCAWARAGEQLQPFWLRAAQSPEVLAKTRGSAPRGGLVPAGGLGAPRGVAFARSTEPGFPQSRGHGGQGRSPHVLGIPTDHPPPHSMAVKPGSGLTQERPSRSGSWGPSWRWATRPTLLPRPLAEVGPGVGGLWGRTELLPQARSPAVDKTHRHTQGLGGGDTHTHACTFRKPRRGYFHTGHPGGRREGTRPASVPQDSGVWLLALLAGGRYGCPSKKEALDLSGIFHGRKAGVSRAGLKTRVPI